MEFHIAHSDGSNVTNTSDSGYKLTYPPYVEDSPGKFAIYIILASTFLLLGSFGNLLALISVFREKVLRVPENMFLVSLMASDILVATCVLPFSITGVTRGELYFYPRVQLCDFLGAVCWIACNAAFWSITGLAINRMILSYFPRQYGRIFTWRTTPAIASLAWLLSFVTYAPTLSSWVEMQYDPESMICQYDLDFWPTNFYQFAILILSIASTFVSIILAVIKMRQKRSNLSAIAPNIQLMGAFLSHLEDDSLMKDDRAKELWKELNDLQITLRMLGCIFIASVIHWVPFIVGILSHHIVNYGRDFWTFANLLGHIQPGSDCLCYIIANKYFRSGYKNVLRAIFCCKKSDKVKYSGVARA